MAAPVSTGIRATEQRATPGRLSAAALEAAIETARSHLPIQRRIVHPDFWEPMVIVDTGDRLAVYSADAWVEPTTPPLLPWHPPRGTVVGHVTLDGTHSPA